MTVHTRMDHYLKDHHIPYRRIVHRHSNSSLHSAHAAAVQPMHLAKGVVLEDHDGKHLMAILPANAKVSLSVLNDEFQAKYHLVKERDIYQMFDDCDRGAVPPLGSAYHMNMVCDSSLMELDHVYLESGDHETLIRLDKDAFNQLMEFSHSRKLRFGTELFH
ncbi:MULTISPECIES: aminoacyl-tRNA deacylase [Vibrio]|uniref:YbaK/EbsC family protein n=1 Tax=Vibrio ostreae TaxID=2841925 RepID=A0A975YLU1_9VIBR|nr:MULTISPECIES: YbaK/EbsC family protein [Vibrio]QXO15735.1 YbaK/EbsC family protein [Vibrio ostreae]WGY45700.1 YbaK/EbsC family protein [Vibrio sp. ABG19]